MASYKTICVLDSVRLARFLLRYRAARNAVCIVVSDKRDRSLLRLFLFIGIAESPVGATIKSGNTTSGVYRERRGQHAMISLYHAILLSLVPALEFKAD